jgi:hypothetical protein
VSPTTTEGGYYAGEGEGGAFGYLSEALRRRRDRGVAPFTVLSCDNIQGNGDVANARNTELAPGARAKVAFPQLDGGPDHAGHHRRRPGVAGATIRHRGSLIARSLDN